MAKYTIDILKNGAGGLDGETLLDITAPGVVVTRPTNAVGVVQVVVPDGVLLGQVDPGQLVGRPSTSVRLTSFNVASNGGAPLAGDTLSRRGIPAPGLPLSSAPSVLLDDLAVSLGIFIADAGEVFFPPFQTLAFLVTQTGPHRIVMTMEDV